MIAWTSPKRVSGALKSPERLTLLQTDHKISFQAKNFSASLGCLKMSRGFEARMAVQVAPESLVSVTCRSAVEGSQLNQEDSMAFAPTAHFR